MTCRKKFLQSVCGSRILFPAPLGGVAQLGERLTGSQEVRGSIPLVSTQEFSRPSTQLKVFFCISTRESLGPVPKLSAAATVVGL